MRVSFYGDLRKSDASAGSKQEKIAAYNVAGPSLSPETEAGLKSFSSFDESFDAYCALVANLDPDKLPIAIWIGCKLRIARTTQGLTQAKMSELTGLTQSTISEIEQGKGTSGPNCATVAKIAKALNLRLDLVPAAVTDAAA